MSQDAYYDSLLSLRHPVAFYDGHISTVAINVIRLDYCVRLGKGESIWTESSFKLSMDKHGYSDCQPVLGVQIIWIESVSSFPQTLFEMT